MSCGCSPDQRHDGSSKQSTDDDRSAFDRPDGSTPALRPEGARRDIASCRLSAGQLPPLESVAAAASVAAAPNHIRATNDRQATAMAACRKRRRAPQPDMGPSSIKGSLQGSASSINDSVTRLHAQDGHAATRRSYNISVMPSASSVGCSYLDHGLVSWPRDALAFNAASQTVAISYRNSIFSGFFSLQ